MRHRYSHIVSVFLWMMTGTLLMSVQAQTVASYYASANGKKAAELKTAMHKIITSHTNIGYDGLLTAYHESDVRPDGYLRDWYSNVTKFVIGGPAENHQYSKEGDGYNREHSVPQSWFSKREPMKSDLVHVLPTDGYVNNRRSSYPLGENKGGVYMSKNGYSKVGACTVSGYTGTCFEPNDEIKGDMARIYFYMVTCYEDKITGWNGGTASQVFDGKTYPGLKKWTLDMMLRWAKQDPVDARERARNEVVYKYQKNRNPFVDYPSLCEYVWGDSTAYAFDVYASHEGGGGQIVPTDPSTPTDPINPGTNTPVNPDAQSGSVDLSRLSWTAATHPSYGQGFTATTDNALVISYFTNTSQNAVITSNDGIRLYKGAVLLIEGAELTKVVFHAADTKLDVVTIGGQDYNWQDLSTLTWEGSMTPFVAEATGGQSRIASIDITIKEVAPSDPDPDSEDDVFSYYQTIQGLGAAALKRALHDLMQPASVLEYGGGEGHTWSGFSVVDTLTGGFVRDRYSNVQRSFDGTAAVQGMNIEHIWANSWWGHTVNNAYCDLFNLYPADGTANGRKSNNPIGIVDGIAAYDNGVIKVGKSCSYRTDSIITVWEPADTWKGDFARTYFYMSTMYAHMANEWQTTEGLLTVDPTSWQTMRPWVSQLMLQWAAQDPVDAIEQERNEGIFLIQGNRNPYVDYPQLADYVWGDHQEQVFYIHPEAKAPELFVPQEGMTLNFGLQALAHGMQRSVTVRGRNFTDGLEVTLEGEGFRMPLQSLTSDEVTAGIELPIESAATAAGDYQATLVLRDADGFEQRVPLAMTVIDGIPAYEGTNIVCSVNNKSFTASWMNMQLEDNETYTLEVYQKDETGAKKLLTAYPVETADTFYVVSGLKASNTYYYQVTAHDHSLVSNEVQVEMPAVKPIFTVSPTQMEFSALPDEPSASQQVKVTLMEVTQYVTTITCLAPFEVSEDGEVWGNTLTLKGAKPTFWVRLSASESGSYEGELLLTAPEVNDVVVPLSASVDAAKAFFESFELGTKGGYAAGETTCNATTWLMENALLAADANSNGKKSVRMKIGGSLTMTEDKQGGCDSLWFYAGLYGGDSGVLLTVNYSLDAGMTWSPVVTDLAFVNGEWKRYAYAIEQEGPIRLRFATQAGNQNKRLNLDDIQMSNYVAASRLTVPTAESDSSVRIFTLDGRYVGSVIPNRPGIYVIHRGLHIQKKVVR